MKIYKAYIEIICGEYGFGNDYLIVAKNIKEAERKAKEYIDEENSLYPGETFYKLDGLEELRFVDGYKLTNYNLKRL
ncbi:MAG: hypothetical protein QME57_05060 [Patescibacteria group bacterium]|nr:hypothetical protein [Patescibacteria group bacterium]